MTTAIKTKGFDVYSDMIVTGKITCNREHGTIQMKTKLLFWSTVLFIILALNTGDRTLFFFFAIHSSMLFIGLSVHKLVYKFQSRINAEPLPEPPPAKK